MNPTSVKYNIGDVVNFKLHRRNGLGRIFEAYSPGYNGTIVGKGCASFPNLGYIIEYISEYGAYCTHMWIYDQEIID